MNGPLPPSVTVLPDFLIRQQPPARFALCDDGRMLVTVGDQQLTLMPEDLRRLERFVGTFGDR